MKYKVGERVRIVSKASGILSWTDEVDVYLGKVMTISGIKTTIITGGYYIMKEDNGYWPWYENSIAGLASEVPFNFGAWKDKNVCMHCRTSEEAVDFRCEMHKAGLRWDSGLTGKGAQKMALTRTGEVQIDRKRNHRHATSGNIESRVELSARLHDSVRRSYKADKAENKAASKRT